MILNFKKVKSSALIILMASSLGLFGCGFGKKKAGFSGSSNNDANDGTADILIDKSAKSGDANKKSGNTGSVDDDDFIRTVEVDVGIKNFLQINASFSALTGVPITNTNIVSTFNGVKNQLPSGNSIKTFSPSVQVAVSKLAVEYCNAMIADNDLRSERVPGFNFDGNVQTAFGGTGVDTLINGLISHMWQGVAATPNEAASKVMLKTLYTELSQGLENSGAAQTKNISSGMCTAVLSSSAVTFL